MVVFLGAYFWERGILFACTSQGFPNSINEWGISPSKGEWKILLDGIFSMGGGNMMSNFDHPNLFQSSKEHTVNIERQ